MIDLEVKKVIDSLTEYQKNNGVDVEVFIQIMVEFGYASNEHKTLLKQVF